MMLKPWTRWQAKPAYTSVVSDNENEEDEKLSSEPFLPSSPDPENVDAKLKRQILILELIISILVSTALVAILFVLFRITKNPYKPLLSTPVPEINMVVTVFEKNETLSMRPTPESNAAWDDLLPPGRGFVYVSDGSSYNLEPGQYTPWGEIYSVSVFHQLHCLGEIRRFYWIFFDGLLAGNGTEEYEKAMKYANAMTKIDNGHISHCIDYIRQGIMCAGDMAMEWPRTEPNGRRIAVDGWGVPHDCKNWDAIQDYMGEKHFNWSTNSHIAPDRM